MSKSKCSCPYGERSLGRLDGINMGRGLVRLSTDPDCRLHNDHAYGEEPCIYCGRPRVIYDHPETRSKTVSE